MKHIKALDTLRAFAVSFVIIDHWGPTFDQASHQTLYRLKKYLVPDGQAGVDLFFVLSGFLITAILLQARVQQGKNGKRGIITNFIVRRALRIFPIYYLMLFVLWAINYPGLADNMGYYLTYTSNILFYREAKWGAIPHTWSLAVEEQFYLVWPWLILYVGQKYLKWVFITAIFTGIVSGYLVNDVLGKGCYPILVYNCIGCFGLGGYYAWALTREGAKRRFERWLFPVFVICLAVYFYWKHICGSFWAHTTFLFRMVDGIIALKLIVFVLNNKWKWLQQHVLENRVLNYIGIISYGIYLYHYALGRLYDEWVSRLYQAHPGLPAFIMQYYMAYIIKLALLLLLCSASYYCIERPLLRLKNRFSYNF